VICRDSGEIALKDFYIILATALFIGLSGAPVVNGNNKVINVFIVARMALELELAATGQPRAIGTAHDNIVLCFEFFDPQFGIGVAVVTGVFVSVVCSEIVNLEGIVGM
jgi:hypothetical protein